MPHKHTRRRDGDDAAQFDLPPTTAARPLPVGKQASKSSQPKSKQKTRQRGGPNAVVDYGADDTPKAFARLMQFASRPARNGLDDGTTPRSTKPKSSKAASSTSTATTVAAADRTDNANNPSRKRKRGQDTPSSLLREPSTTPASSTAAAASSGPTELPLKIQPRESLSAFSARVDRAMPLSGLARRGKETGARVTRHEKRLRRLQAGWRAEEARIRELEEERREAEEEAEEELREAYGEEVGFGGPGKVVAGRKKGRRRGGEEDPWAVLKEKREGPRGLHDVVKAPPRFERVPREMFKVRDGAGVRIADVPSAAGSLRRREELRDARRGVIESYRRMMEAKRSG